MDYASFQSTYVNEDGTFQTNTVRAVSEADLRQFARDILGSFAMSASSNLSAQVYEIGDWNTNGAGVQSKLVYCGPSSNVVAAKFYGIEIVSDTDAIPYAKYTSPFFSSVDNGIALYSGGLFANGASASITISASGFFNTSTGFNQATNYNRGYVTLFF